MFWIYLGLAALVTFGLLLMGPLLMGRMFMPRMTVTAFVRWGGWLGRCLDRISPGLDLRLMVKAGNRYFRNAFSATPAEERILFLPFCLRPAGCPAPVDPELGLVCESACPGCRLGEVRDEALGLGYRAVYVVPSSRMLPNRGLMPSDQFIRHKIRQESPSAALGVVCGWHLRHRLMPRHKVGRGGLHTGDNGGRSVIQGVLLDSKSCRGASVDWAQVRRLLRQGAAPAGTVAEPVIPARAA